MTYTLEVTDVDEDLLLRIDQRAQQHGQDRSACILDLVQHALKEEELTEFINAEIHQMRRERKPAAEAVHQEAA